MKRKKSYDYVLLLILSIVSSGINYLSNIVYGRLLSVEEYGAASFMLAFLSNIVFCMSPIQTMICTFVASKRNKVQIINAIKFGILLTIVESVGLIVFKIRVEDFLQIDHVIFGLLVLYLFSALFYFCTLSIIQGQKKFVVFGVISCMLMGIKMLVGVAFISFFDCGRESILIGNLVAYILCGIIGLKYIAVDGIWAGRKWIDRLNFDFIRDSEVLNFFGWSFVLVSLVNLFINGGEVILMTGKVNNRELGMYSVSITIAKIGLYVVTMIGTVLLPEIASLHERKQRITVLKSTIGITIGIVCAFSTIVLLGGRWIILALFGARYVEASAYLPVALFFSGVICVFYVFYQYAMAEGNFKYLTISMIFFSCALLLINGRCELQDVRCVPIEMAGILLLSLLFYIWQSVRKGNSSTN